VVARGFSRKGPALKMGWAFLVLGGVGPSADHSFGAIKLVEQRLKRTAPLALVGAAEARKWL